MASIVNARKYIVKGSRHDTSGQESVSLDALRCATGASGGTTRRMQGFGGRSQSQSQPQNVQIQIDTIHEYDVKQTDEEVGICYPFVQR